MEVYFLFKKIFALTTSLVVSIFGTNEFYAQASVLKNINKEVINIGYLENYDNNYDVNLDNSISTENTTNDIAIDDINFTSTATNMINDVSIYNKKVKEAEESKKIDTKSNNSQKTYSTYKAIYTMEATAYTGDTITATGTTPVRNPNGISTIAVDPSIIPLGSKVYIPGYGEALATDTGGAIKGHRIDLFLNSEDECINWGRQNVSLYLLAYPGEW